MRSIRKLKQIFAMALAMIMMFAMSVPVLADEAANAAYSITIKNAVGTYNAYQVFGGDLVTDSEGKQILSNVEWGSGVTPFTYQEMTEAKDIAEFLSGKGEDEAKAFADEAAKHVKTAASGTATADGGKAVISGLEPGYYVILNTLGDDDKNESVSRYILQITADQEVENKADVPSFEKKLKDINDTTDKDYTGWQDSADYDIGDKIPFKLEGTVAANYDEYKGAYKFVFHDQEEAGLTFMPESVKVFVDDQEITSGYKVKTSGLDDGCTFEVIFENLKDINSVKTGSKVRVEYNSELNDSAVLGQKGNANKGKLEFSNNPNNEQGGTGETPWDNVIVFTYQVTADKYHMVDGEKTALEGAKFGLYKEVPEGTTGAQTIQIKGQDVTVISIGEKEGEADSQGVKCIFNWKGLDDGNYVIVETQTPAGYNTADPIEFTITAEHDVTSDDPHLTQLNGGDLVTGDVSTGILSTSIENKSGTTLPSTGGIGTRIFYLVGGVLAAGAAILLIVKRRMSREN